MSTNLYDIWVNIPSWIERDRVIFNPAQQIVSGGWDNFPSNRQINEKLDKIIRILENLGLSEPDLP